MLAGGIAMMIALLAMQLISRVLGPWLLLTEFMAGMTMRRLLGFTGELARFLLHENPTLRVTLFLVVLFLAAAVGLGTWTNQEPNQLNQRVMQAAAILLFATFTLVYLADSGTLQYFLQEVLLTLALSSLVFAVVLHRLLEPNTNQTRWRIAGAVAVIGLFVIVRDAMVG